MDLSKGKSAKSAVDISRETKRPRISPKTALERPRTEIPRIPASKIMIKNPKIKPPVDDQKILKLLTSPT